LKKPQHLLAFSKEMILSDINLSEKKINFIRGHNTQLNDMVYSSNKELIGSCSDDLILKLWKIDRKFKLMMTLKGHKKEIVAIAFKPSKFEKNLSFNKNFLASGSLDFSLRIWDINNKTCLKFIRIEGPVFSIEWSLVSDTIVLGSCGKTYKKFRVTMGFFH
jgi:WD40 repeat protein